MLRGIFIHTGLILGAFVFMEFVAWFTHKFVMHGFLWNLHEDHHRPHTGWWEKNDFFTLFFMSIAIFLIIFGLEKKIYYYFSLGLGVTLYGMGYFLFHDIMFHRRLKILRISAGTSYLKRLVKAHATHHQSRDQRQATCYGFLFASRKYDV